MSLSCNPGGLFLVAALDQRRQERFRLNVCAVFFVLWSLISAGGFVDTGWASSEWTQLESGLALRHWPDGAHHPELTVLRIDPEFFRFVLYSASAERGADRTVRQWVEDKNLVAAINASMYWEDRETSTGLMTNFGHVNNGRVHPEFGAFFVANPRRAQLPPVDILDRSLEQQWRKRVAQYATIIQNYRLLDAKGENVWQASRQEHSSAVVAEDSQGHILFILQHEPVSVHALGSRLENLSLDLGTAMFVEGGVEASLAVRCPELKTFWNGRYDSRLLPAPVAARPVPNIIGITRRRSDPGVPGIETEPEFFGK